MEIPRPTEADKDFFRSVLPGDPSVEVKPMFGNLGAFVHGNMFAGLFGPAVGVRLDDAGRTELEGIDGSGPFGRRAPDGRLYQPARSLRATPEVAAHWVERALTHVSGLPPKVKKPKAPRK